MCFLFIQRKFYEIIFSFHYIRLLMISVLTLLCVSLAFLDYLVAQVDKTSSEGWEFDEVDEVVDWVALLGHEGVRLGLVEPDLGLHHSAAASVNCLDGSFIWLDSLWHQKFPKQLRSLKSLISKPTNLTEYLSSCWFIFSLFSICFCFI